ncbi:hypothetical protein [Hippea jasoniae]|uniref:hypothetical protein n=1 Tax=Hippea jasoniae TaxID=944479 RepID=UPI0012EC0870|nr:hypothetical protein [Hippea jasoniae]
MKYIDESKEVFEFMEKYKSQNLLALSRYKNLDFLLSIIEEWKMFVNGYFKYKNEYLLVRYEDLIRYPFETIKKIDNKNMLDDKIIKDAIDKTLNKNLVENLPNIHKYFRHYNPGRKIGDFNRFLTDDMIDFVYSLTKNELKALGYDMSELVDKSIEKYERIDEIGEVYKDLVQGYKLIENSSSIAILGAARAATITYEDLKEKFNVICFIDDFKTGELFSIPIVSREEFRKKFADRVGFIVRGPYQKGFDITELAGKKILTYESVLKFFNSYDK